MQLQLQGKAGKGGKGTALAIRSGPSKGKGGGARKSKFGDLCSMQVFHSSNFPVVQGDVNQCQPTVVEDKVGTYCHLLSLSL
jgi:hypothetical protein